MKPLEFAPVLITDVFETLAASSAWYDKNKIARGDGAYPYVSRSGVANGHESVIGQQSVAPNTGNAITIGVDTQTVFYQPTEFYTSVKIQVLRHPNLSEVNGPVLVTILRRQMSKFQWGNGASLDRLRATRILVPVTTDDSGEQFVDWDGMTRLGEELFAEVTERAAEVSQADYSGGEALPDLNFEPMYVIDVPGRQKGLFHAHKGKRLITAHRKPGGMPFVAGSRFNNSIVDFADVPALFPGGWLTLIYNGDGGTGHAKYQPAPFSASDDVIVLEPISNDASEEALLLAVSLLTHQCVPKFGFGYKLTLHRLGRQKILVPATTDSDGEIVVDWEGMSQYGRALRVRAEQSIDTALGVSP